MYGNAANRVDILKELYGAEQRNDEDVISWNCCLEDIIGRARDMRAIHPPEVKRMLHDILWNGLRKDLKDASGHKYDSIKDFDSLRVAIRQIEMKHTLEEQLYEKEKKSKANPAKAAQVTPTTTEKSDIEELKGIVQQLVSKVDSYDRERQQTSGSYQSYRNLFPVCQTIGLADVDNVSDLSNICRTYIFLQLQLNCTYTG